MFHNLMSLVSRLSLMTRVTDMTAPRNFLQHTILTIGDNNEL